jgi:peptide/nickel transport system permease protein
LVVLALLYASAAFAPLLASDLPYYLRGEDSKSYEAARTSLAPVSAALLQLAELRPAQDDEAWRARLGREIGALRLRLDTLAAALEPKDRSPAERCRAALDALDPKSASLAEDARAIQTLASETALELAPRRPGSAEGRVELAARSSWPLFAALSPLDWALLALGPLLLASPLVARASARARWTLWLAVPALAAVVGPLLPLGPAARGGASLKQTLTSGEFAVERVMLPPIFYGWAETRTAEIFQPPSWIRRRASDAAPAAGPALRPAPVRVDERFGEPAVGTPWRHLAGTDAVGRDLCARILWGGRVSLVVGLAAALLLTLVGVVFGAAAGFLGGRTDFVISRAIEIALAIPALYLIVLAAAYVDPDVLSPLVAIVLIIAAVAWTGVARLVRAEMLRLRASEFVLAARALGFSEARILFAHALPNALSPALVAATFAVGGGILTESVVSYLGFGVQHPLPSWGALINESRSAAHWWIQFFPGLFIFAAVASFNLLGEALRDALDPRSEGRRT